MFDFLKWFGANDEDAAEADDEEAEVGDEDDRGRDDDDRAPAPPESGRDLAFSKGWEEWDLAAPPAGRRTEPEGQAVGGGSGGPSRRASEAEDAVFPPGPPPPPPPPPPTVPGSPIQPGPGDLRTLNLAGSVDPSSSQGPAMPAGPVGAAAPSSVPAHPGKPKPEPLPHRNDAAQDMMEVLRLPRKRHYFLEKVPPG